jgi:hypothetical protein
MHTCLSVPAQCPTLVGQTVLPVSVMSAVCIALQTLVTTALGVVPQCSAAALKNLLWALGTVGSADHRLLLALEAQLLSQSPYLG